MVKLHRVPKTIERSISTKILKVIRKKDGDWRENLPKRLHLRKHIDRVRGAGWSIPLCWSSTRACYCLNCAEIYMWGVSQTLEQQMEELNIGPLDEKRRVKCDCCHQYTLNFRLTF